jgi:hypothetical protein
MKDGDTRMLKLMETILKSVYSPRVNYRKQNLVKKGSGLVGTHIRGARCLLKNAFLARSGGFAPLSPSISSNIDIAGSFVALSLRIEFKFAMHDKTLAPRGIADGN